jgi:DNA invertase Pin-like site-specific DNA recombinase
MNSDLKYFAYCRKSSEDSQKQIASIGDQINALSTVAKREGIILERSFTEERSAKDPGRAVFDDMLKRIQAGEANALLCWDIDRLSRNPIDNGRLQWMLQKSVIKVIKTPGRSYYPEDAGLLMSIEGGRATDYVMRLSKNVKRGMDSRVAKGWRPNLAPIGYLNKGDKGDKTVIADEKNFEIVRQMWDLFLTGTYQVSDILDIANNKWGLRTTIRRKLGGKPLSRSQLYKIFVDPFYYGYFWWGNPITGEKELMRGNHTPMITEKEYRRAQVLLGRKGKQQPQIRDFYATGILRCGECKGTVTAEEKHQLICTKCKNKFGYENKTACPKCRTDISEMKNPSILNYTYYHCTKRPCKTCTQGSIRLEDLEKQFNEVLAGLTFDKDYLNLALEYLGEKQNNSGDSEKKIRDSLQAAYDNVQTRLKNLSRE